MINAHLSEKRSIPAIPVKLSHVAVNTEHFFRISVASRPAKIWYAHDMTKRTYPSTELSTDQRELIARAWRGLVVESGNLRVQITFLRRTLGEGEQGMRYIANVPAQGYCFVAPVMRGSRRMATALYKDAFTKPAGHSRSSPAVS